MIDGDLLQAHPVCGTNAFEFDDSGADRFRGWPVVERGIHPASEDPALEHPGSQQGDSEVPAAFRRGFTRRFKQGDPAS